MSCGKRLTGESAKLDDATRSVSLQGDQNESPTGTEEGGGQQALPTGAISFERFFRLVDSHPQNFANTEDVRELDPFAVRNSLGESSKELHRACVLRSHLEQRARREGVHLDIAAQARVHHFTPCNVVGPTKALAFRSVHTSIPFSDVRSVQEAKKRALDMIMAAEPGIVQVVRADSEYSKRLDEICGNEWKKGIPKFDSAEMRSSTQAALSTRIQMLKASVSARRVRTGIVRPKTIFSRARRPVGRQQATVLCSDQTVDKHDVADVDPFKMDEWNQLDMDF